MNKFTRSPFLFLAKYLSMKNKSFARSGMALSIICVTVLAVLSVQQASAQIPNCDGTVPTFTVNVTGSNVGGSFVTADTSRQGHCCGATGSDNCIHFILITDPHTASVSIAITKGAVPNGSLYFQIDC